MACIVKNKSKVIYIKQRYRDEEGNSKQKMIRCKDSFEARELLPIVQSYEDKGLPYIDTRPAVYTPAYGSKPQVTYSLEMTVAELMPLFFEYAAKSGNWRPNTLSTKQGIARNYIIPHIGDEAVVKITSGYIQDYFDDLQNHKCVPGNHKSEPKQMTYRNIREVRKVLSRAFQFAAMKLRIIPVNPINSDVKIPKDPFVQKPQWTHEQCLTALSADTDDHQLLLIMSLLYCGPLRVGETLGLTWDCIHFPAVLSDNTPAFIEIKQELQEIDIESLELTRVTPRLIVPPIKPSARSRACIVNWTKTTRSTRTIFLPKNVAEKLLEHKQRQEDMKQYYNGNYQDYNFVFAYEERFPGRPLSQNAVNLRFKRLVKELGLPMVRLYSLRAAGTSELLRHTSNPKVVQTAMGGDTEAVMMEHYAVAAIEDQKKLAASLNASTFDAVANLVQKRQNETK